MATGVSPQVIYKDYFDRAFGVCIAQILSEDKGLGCMVKATDDGSDSDRLRRTRILPEAALRSEKGWRVKTKERGWQRKYAKNSFEVLRVRW